jgi:hypothetical protein
MDPQAPQTAVWLTLLRARGWRSWVELVAWVQERDGGGVKSLPGWGRRRIRFVVWL